MTLARTGFGIWLTNILLFNFSYNILPIQFIAFTFVRRTNDKNSNMARVRKLEEHKESSYYEVKGDKHTFNVRISGHEPVASKSFANDIFFTCVQPGYYMAYINGADLWDSFAKVCAEDIAEEDEDGDIIYNAGDLPVDQQHQVLLERVKYLAD